MAPADHGTTSVGTPITDRAVEALADEAEAGYDVEELMQRRAWGRPTMGSAAASVESVRLDPELKRDLLLRAAQEQRLRRHPLGGAQVPPRWLRSRP